MKKLSGGGRCLASAACLAMPAAKASAKSKSMKSIFFCSETENWRNGKTINGCGSLITFNQ